MEKSDFTKNGSGLPDINLKAHQSLRNNNVRIVETLGEFNPARGILLAIYTTILAASIYLLIYPDTKFAIALLLVQIVYKLLTPFTVKTLKHPFVISNVLIAVVHIWTVYTLQ